MTFREWTHAHTRTVIGAIFLLAFLGWLYVHESKNKGLELAELKQFFAEKDTERAKEVGELKATLAAANAKIADLENKKQQVIANPSLAPIIIRDTIPTSTPIQQTAPITKDTPPDAPVATVTRQQEQELATFGLTCQQCFTERTSLAAELVASKNEVKRVTEERDKAVETVQGGSVKHRVTRVLTVSGAAGLGAGAGAQVKKPGSAAIGAVLGAIIGFLLSK